MKITIVPDNTRGLKPDWAKNLPFPPSKTHKDWFEFECPYLGEFTSTIYLQPGEKLRYSDVKTLHLLNAQIVAMETDKPKARGWGG